MPSLSFFSRYSIVTAKLCFINKRTVQWLCALHKFLCNPWRYRGIDLPLYAIYSFKTQSWCIFFYLSLGTLPHRICHLHTYHILEFCPRRGPEGWTPKFLYLVYKLLKTHLIKLQKSIFLLSTI